MLAHEPRLSSSLGMHLDKDGRGLPASYRLHAQNPPPFSSQRQTFAVGPAAYFGTLLNCGLAVTDLLAATKASQAISILKSVRGAKGYSSTPCMRKIFQQIIKAFQDYLAYERT